jgi:N-acetylmuramoyl-L-alanine amidase
MKVLRNRLVSESNSDRIQQLQTSNKGGLITPNYIIIHFTAGRSPESSIQWFQNPTAKASAHLIIARDGTITQLIDFNRKAWHAGISSWGNKSGFNNFSIGIELDNPGRLHKVGDKYLSWFKKEYPKDDVVEDTHKHESKPSYWYEYSQPQIEACLEVCKLLTKAYKIEDILGHDDISPYRKDDTGPLFPMENFRSRILGRQDENVDIYEVNATTVNIRKGPGTSHDILGVLKKGTKVEYVKSNAGWLFVEVDQKSASTDDILYGWINSKLLTKV